MAETLGDVFWVIVGSILIAAGSGIAGLYAFENRVFLVTAGFFLFFAGYRVSQFGVHYSASEGSVIGGSLRGFASARALTRGALLGVGGVGIGFGVTLFTQTILDPTLGDAILAGVSSIGGYIVAHVGMNGSLL